MRSLGSPEPCSSASQSRFLLLLWSLFVLGLITTHGFISMMAIYPYAVYSGHTSEKYLLRKDRSRYQMIDHHQLGSSWAATGVNRSRWTRFHNKERDQIVMGRTSSPNPSPHHGMPTKRFFRSSLPAAQRKPHLYFGRHRRHRVRQRSPWPRYISDDAASAHPRSPRCIRWTPGGPSRSSSLPTVDTDTYHDVLSFHLFPTTHMDAIERKLRSGHRTGTRLSIAKRAHATLGMPPRDAKGSRLHTRSRGWFALGLEHIRGPKGIHRGISYYASTRTPTSRGKRKGKKKCENIAGSRDMIEFPRSIRGRVFTSRNRVSRGVGLLSSVPDDDDG